MDKAVSTSRPSKLFGWRGSRIEEKLQKILREDVIEESEIWPAQAIRGSDGTWPYWRGHSEEMKREANSRRGDKNVNIL